MRTLDTISPFKTTRRNRRRYALTVSLIFAICSYLFLVILGDWSIKLWISLMVIGAIWVLFGILSGPPYWNMGWNRRLPIVFVGLLASALVAPIVLLPGPSSSILLRSFARILAGIALVSMPLIYPWNLFASRRQAHLRYLFHLIRHDRIRVRTSPSITIVTFPYSLVRGIERWLRGLPAATWFVLTFVISFAIPVVVEIFLRQHVNHETHYYIILGTATGLLVVFLVLVVWIVSTRHKHIVLPFKIMGDGTENLEATSHIVTHAFVEELQRIRQLLQARQVEIADMGASSELAMFITSGHEQNLIQQFEALGDIQFSGSTIPLGSFLSILVTRLARSTVRGYIQKESEDKLVIWAEVTTRSGDTQSIGSVTVMTDDVTKQIELSLRDKAAELAGKLTLKTGNTNYFSASWDSFRFLLAGLEASRQQDWWHAISNYRRAIHIEETERGTFGLGHFHLGAALLFQGDYLEGLEHLNIARRFGPPLPETRYMVGLAQVYVNADRLDKEETFSKIDGALRSACRMRHNFPEAFHLRGMIYYMRGRLVEERMKRSDRCVQNDIDKQRTCKQIALSDYQNATKFLRKALRKSRRAYRRLERKRHNPGIQNLLQAMDNMMAIKHRLGDVLRVQELFSLADSYYDDVIEAHPEDTRTLTDRGKIYCLAQNWQRAYEYLRERVLDVAPWQPEANFYMGWTRIIGAIVEPEVKYVDAKKEFTAAFAELDYALATQPGLIRRWRETNWYPPAFTAVVALTNQKTLTRYRRDWFRLGRIGAWTILNLQQRRKKEDREDFDHLSCTLVGTPLRGLRRRRLEAKVEKWQEHNIAEAMDLKEPPAQLRWLAWRTDSLTLSGNRRGVEKRDPVIRLRGTTPNPAHERAYKALRLGRRVLERIVRERADLKAESSLAADWQRLRLAERLRHRWQEIDIDLRRTLSTESLGDVTFAERWTVDLYAEYGLILARLLAEGKAYALAAETARITVERIAEWIERARSEDAQNEKHLGLAACLSPKLLAFQIATLRSWQAYAEYLSSCRQPIRMGSVLLESELEATRKREIDELAKQAYQECSFQPLASFVDAHLLITDDYHGHAVDTLLDILAKLDTFDPHVYIAAWSLRHRAEIDQEVRSAQNIAGLEQFKSVTSRAHIHQLLAAVLHKQGKTDLAIRHIQSAIVWSPYDDTDAAHFLSLTNYLRVLNRTEEALAAAQEVKRRLRNLTGGIRCSQIQEARVLESLLHTNRAEYVRALEIMKTLEKFPPFDEGFQSLGLPAELNYIAEHVIQMINDLTHDNRRVDQKRWVSLAACINHLQDLMPPSRSNQPIHEVMIDRICLEMAAEALRITRQWARVANNTGYSYAQLRINLQSAMKLTSESLKVSVLSNDRIPWNAREVIYRNLFAVDSGGAGWQVDPAAEGALSQIHGEDREVVAHHFDTRGWIRYRMGELDRALDDLEKACYLSPNSANTHYHLARVYVSRLEQEWQTTGFINDGALIGYYLRQARRHWQSARRYDPAGQLSAAESRLAERLNVYTENWESLWF